MNIISKNIVELKPYENNPKIHTDSQIEQIATGKQIVVEDGGGFQIRLDNNTISTFQSYNGKVYNISDLFKNPEEVDTNKSATEIVRGMLDRGIDVTILSPKQIQQRQEEYNNRPGKGIDYQLEIGVPWGSRAASRRARWNRLSDRAQRRKK